MSRAKLVTVKARGHGDVRINADHVEGFLYDHLARNTSSAYKLLMASGRTFSVSVTDGHRVLNALGWGDT